MHRLLMLMIVCFTLALPVMVLAQEITPPDPNVTAQQAAQRAEDAARRADDSANAASRAANDSSNYLGIFESVGTAIGVLTGVFVPALAIVAGAVGLNRLNNAKEELNEARERLENDLQSLRQSIEQELKDNQTELSELKHELERRADDERIKSEQATLALSLLPLAEQQYKVKDLEGALDTYHKALSLDPDNLVIHYRLGYVYTQYGSLEEATRYLTRALELDPGFAPALANIGFVLRRKAEPLNIRDIQRGELLAEAEQKMRQALALSPKLVDEDGESWWGPLGGLHRRRGQIDDAIEAYSRAHEVTPMASYPLSNLALLYMQKNDRTSMIQTYQRAERLAMRRTLIDLSDHWAWADILVARLALGKYPEAEEALESLLAVAPTHAGDVLNTVLGTVRLLVRALDSVAAEQIESFIERLEAQLALTGKQPVK
jgi:tetratricopeptide (TPR) repeat protein